VIRGGSWNNNGSNCQAAIRNRNTPANRNNNIGLRLARAPRGPRRRYRTEPAALPFRQGFGPDGQKDDEPPGVSSRRERSGWPFLLSLPRTDNFDRNDCPCPCNSNTPALSSKQGAELGVDTGPDRRSPRASGDLRSGPGAWSGDRATTKTRRKGAEERGRESIPDTPDLESTPDPFWHLLAFLLALLASWPDGHP
jgi:hypothetical protein